jgi:hypothetical protein
MGGLARKAAAVAGKKGTTAVAGMSGLRKSVVLSGWSTPMASDSP